MAWHDDKFVPVELSYNIGDNKEGSVHCMVEPNKHVSIFLTHDAAIELRDQLTKYIDDAKVSEYYKGE